jgi:hypothetical protein
VAGTRDSALQLSWPVTRSLRAVNNFQQLDLERAKLLIGLPTMASTGAQLRQTFKYPTDSDGSDDSREELDEEGKHLCWIMNICY